MKENIEPKTQFIQEMRDFTDRMNERKNEMGGVIHSLSSL